MNTSGERVRQVTEKRGKADLDCRYVDLPVQMTSVLT